MTTCAYSDLRQILVDLGFTVKVVPGSPILFEHPAAKVRLILEPFADSDPVDAVTLAVVRRNLDERGILLRARFEDMLRQQSLAS